MFHYFRFNWFCVVWEVKLCPFEIQISCSVGHPKSKWRCLEYTKHSNAQCPEWKEKEKKHLHLFRFSAPAKIVLCYFSCLFLSQNYEGPKMCAQLHYSNEVNQKIHRLSHVASNMQQTRARFAFRLKHSLNALNKSRYVIQFCFIINCSVKYLGVTVSMTLLISLLWKEFSGLCSTEIWEWTHHQMKLWLFDFTVQGKGKKKC